MKETISRNRNSGEYGGCAGVPAKIAVERNLEIVPRSQYDAVMVGEGGRFEVDASPLLIHAQLTVMGSWVTSIGRMEELVERLARWDLHPERTVTDRFSLEHADEAYRVADEGRRGKVAIVTGS